MYVYILIFFVICVVVLLLQNKKPKNTTTTDEKIKKENFQVNIDDVLDNYCKISTGKTNYLGPWDGMTTPTCSLTASPDEFNNCPDKACYVLVKDSSIPHDDVYKYESSNIKHINAEGFCIPESGTGRFRCDIVPAQCKTTSNIKGWYFDQYWRSHNCKYFYNSNGVCVLRDTDDHYEEIKILNTSNPSLLVEGDAKTQKFLYSDPGPSCTFDTWDDDVLIDDAGNIYSIESEFLRREDPYDREMENGYMKCANGQSIPYTHIANSDFKTDGFTCGFVGNCDSCEYSTSSCYIFDRNVRNYEKKNFVNTLFDESPNNGVDFKDCGNYLLNTAGDTKFNSDESTDFSTYDNDQLWNIVNHNGEFFDRSMFSNCIRAKPAECSPNNIHKCTMYDTNSNTFIDVNYKQIYDERGSNCEYCPINGLSNCVGNVADYKQDTTCPPLECPKGREILFDENFKPIDCVPCGSNQFYNSNTKQCDTLTPCPQGNILLENHLIRSFNTSIEEHKDVFQKEFIQNYNSMSNIVLMEDLTCGQCAKNTYMDHENKASECLQCGEGKYSELGSSNCTRCVNGYYRSNGMLNCVMCPNGHVSKLIDGKSFCKNCYDTFQIPDEEKVNCVNCPTDSTFDVDNTRCRIKCDSSNYWNSEVKRCDPIPDGKYKEEIFSESILATTDSLINCPPNTYRKEGMLGNSVLSCIPCENGNSAEGSSECMTCEIGSFWDVQSNVCNFCTGSNEVVNLTKTACALCENPPGYTPTHKIPNVHNTECKCKDGYHTHSLNKECFICNSNAYWVQDSNSCVSCPPGQVGLNNVGKICKMCDSNTYRSENMSNCEPCFEGSYSGLGASNCIVCDIHEYWDPNGQACRACPDGQIGTGGTGVESCINCPMHTYKGFGMSNCEPCNTMYGLFSLDEGSTECQSCGGDGYYYDVALNQCLYNECGPTGINVATSTGYNCFDCYLDVPQKIAKRADGVTITSDQCVSCQDNAKPTRSNVCVCNEGYKMNYANECVKCDNLIEGDYWRNNLKRCEKCPITLYTTGTECKFCGEHAGVDPLDQSKCACLPAFANAGYNIMVDKSCKKCNAELGEVYNPDTMMCEDCSPNTYVDNGECKICDTNSSPDLGDRTKCLCDEGFFKAQDGLCYTCSGVDRYWDDDKKECIRCTDGAFVKNGMCVRCGLNSVRRIGTDICDLDPTAVGDRNPDFFHLSANGLNYKYCDETRRYYWNPTNDMCSQCRTTQIVKDGECASCPANEEPSIMDYTQCLCKDGYSRFEGVCVNPEDSPVCELDEYYKIETFTNERPTRTNVIEEFTTHMNNSNVIENFEGIVKCLKCPASNIANEAGDACVCDTGSGYFGETGKCIACKGDNQIYSSRLNACLVCEGGSQPNEDKSSCVCNYYNNTVPEVNENSRKVRCVCETSNFYFGDPLSSQGCQYCGGNDEYWDNRSNACIRCGHTTGLKRDRSGCECLKRFGTIMTYDSWNGMTCACDSNNHFYGDVSIGNSCQRCSPSNNQYWDLWSNRCVQCGQGAIATPAGCECEFPYTTLDNNNNCVCDSNQGYYGRPDNCQMCRSEGSNDRFWDPHLNNGTCVTCGYGAQVDSWGKRCECRSNVGVGAKIEIAPNTYICECNSNQFFFGDIEGPRGCVECRSSYWDGSKYWRPTRFGGECITCGSGTILRNNRCECSQQEGAIFNETTNPNTCECDNITHFGNIIVPGGCVRCDGEKEYWNQRGEPTNWNHNGECVTCGTGAIADKQRKECVCQNEGEIINNYNECVCDSNNNWFFDPNLDRCARCEQEYPSAPEKYWNNLRKVCITCGDGTHLSADGTRCVCLEGGSNVFDNGTNTQTCVCNSRRELYGDINEGCQECRRDQGKYWDSNLGKCITCGSGTRLEGGRCVCVNNVDDRGAVKSSNIDQQGNITETCECNGTTHFGNVSDTFGCTRCDGENQVWQPETSLNAGRCLTCGEGSQPGFNECECVDNLTTVPSLDVNNNQFKCVCNTSNSYFPNVGRIDGEPQCIACSRDNNQYYKKTYNGGDCITCGGRSEVNEYGTACVCPMENAKYNSNIDLQGNGGCECKTNFGWYGDLSQVATCTKCESDQYWGNIGNGQQCITCGVNTLRKLDKSGCKCVAREGLIKIVDQFNGLERCQCDEANQWYDDGYGRCIKCDGANSIWEGPSDGVKGRCVSCGEGTEVSPYAGVCDCKDSAKAIKKFDNTRQEYTCVCNSNQYYFGLDSEYCTHCSPDNNQYWIPGWNGAEGECVQCGQNSSVNSSRTGCVCNVKANTRLNSTEDDCVCNTSNGYYGNLNILPRCQLCNGQNQYWDSNNQVCMTCGSGSKVNNARNGCQCVTTLGLPAVGAIQVEDPLTDTISCECNNVTHFGDLDTSIGCVQCDGLREFWDNDKLKCLKCEGEIINVDGTHKECSCASKFGTKRVMHNGNTYKCVCDIGNAYYEKQDGSCEFCNTISTYAPTKYWDSVNKQCITCGSGTQKNMNGNACLCVNSNATLDDNTGPIKTCSCDADNNVFLKNNGECVVCSGTDKKYWDGNLGECIKCGYGSEYDPSTKRCKCINNAIANQLIFNTDTQEYVYTCDCDNLSYFGNTQSGRSCQQCVDDDISGTEKYWKHDYDGGNGVCVSCGEASYKQGGLCRCYTGASISTAYNVNPVTGIKPGFQSASHECECPENTVPDLLTKKCECNRTTHFANTFGDCVECVGTNKYWSTTNRCITCGQGAILNQNKDACECSDSNMRLNRSSDIHVCECDNSKKFYNNPTGTGCIKCESTANQSKVWDPNANNGYGQCLTCGYGTRLDFNANQCICNDSLNQVEQINNSIVKCICQNGMFYDEVARRCVNCPTTNTSRWIPSNGTTPGYCQRCDINEVITSSGECICNSNNNYFGVAGSCTQCDPDDVKYWDDEAGSIGQCVTCNYNERLGSGNSCECDTSQHFHGTASSASQSSQCELCGHDGNSHYKNYYNTCLRCGQNERMNMQMCECDPTRNYFGTATHIDSFGSSDGSIVQGSCRYCDMTRGYWQNDAFGGHCVECGTGTSKAANGACTYCGVGHSNLDIVNSDGSVTRTCICNNTTHFDDGSGSCLPCSQNNQYFKNRRCFTCDVLTTQLRYVNGLPQCVCNDPGAKTTTNFNGVVTCECDASQGYFGTNADCSLCTSDNQYDKYYDNGTCKKCDKASGAQVYNNEACVCEEYGKKESVNSSGITSCVCDTALNYYGTSNCTLCPTLLNGSRPYQKYNSGTQSCITCNPNEFIESGVCKCDTFRGFHGTPGLCVECIGTDRYYDAGTNSCIICGANTIKNGNGCYCEGNFVSEYNPATGVITCGPCPPGFYKGTGDVCAPCESGKTTPPNLYQIGASSPSDCSIAISCSPPNYRDPVNSNCSVCPYYSSTKSVDNMLGKSSCKCDAGKYMNNTFSQCVQCPSNKYSHEGSVAPSDCKTCPIGEQANANQTECELCPIGYYKDNLNPEACTRCPSGMTTISEGSQNMDACECGSNTYKSGSRCVICPAGTFSSAGSTMVSDCVSYCSEGEYYSVSDESCHTCGLGKQVNSSGLGCELCPINTYNSGGTGICSPCPGGSGTRYIGSSNIEHCIPEFCPANEYKFLGECEECPDGYTSPAGSTNESQCIPSICLHEGQYIDGNQCEFCPAGKEANPEKTGCIECLEGWYKNSMRGVNGDGLCTQCPEGQTNNSSFKGCAPICTGALEYWNVATLTCETVPPGNVPNATKSDYVPCSNNTYRAQFYPGTNIPMTTCQQCPNHSTNNIIGSSNIYDCVCSHNKVISDNQCQFCPAGMQRRILFPNECTQCSEGTYRSLGTGDDGECKSCPFDRPLSYEGTVSISNCESDACLSGYYKDHTGTCQICPIDRPVSAPNSYNLISCSNCGEGKEPNSSNSGCIPCASNYYKNADQSTCQPCPSYVPYSYGGGNFDSCYTTDCGKGKYYDEFNEICRLCPKGWYSDTDDAIECTICPGGQTTTGEGRSNCILCDANTFRDTSVIESGECLSCLDYYGPGHESVEGSSNCELVQCYAGEELIDGVCSICDDGKYSSDGLTCQTCAPGEQPTINKDGCELCMPGYYSTDGTACLPCGGKGKPYWGGYTADKGTYQDQAGASNCKRCPYWGAVSPEGANTVALCEGCPAGSIPNSNNNRCEPCPDGTTSGHDGANTCSTTCSTGSELVTFFSRNPEIIDASYKRVCTYCPPGTGWINGQCTNCVQHYGSAKAAIVYGTGATCGLCDPGQIANAAGTTCEYCPAGTIRPAGMNSGCSNCPDGTYSSPDHTQCLVCPAGKGPNSNKDGCDFCDEGFASSAGVCAPCTGNTYADAKGLTGCINCGGNVNSDRTECLECTLGTQFNSSTFSCSNCSDGTVLYDLTQASCSNCPERSISDGRHISCLPCGANEISINNTCSNCPDNMFVEGNACISCDPGYEYIDEQCKPCEIGFYYDATTLTCRECGLGRTTLHEGSIDETACICDINKYKEEDSDECSDCPAGSISDIGNNDHYSKCYCPNSLYNGYGVCPPFGSNKCSSGKVTIGSALNCGKNTSKTEINRNKITDAYLPKYVFWSTWRKDKGEPEWNSPAGYFIRDHVVPDDKILDYGLSTMRSFNVLYQSPEAITRRNWTNERWHFMVFRDHLPSLRLDESPNTYKLKLLSTGKTYTGNPSNASMRFYTDFYYRGDMIEHVDTYVDNNAFVIKSFKVSGSMRDQGLYIEVSDSLTGRIKAKILETSTLNMQNGVTSVTSGYYFNTNERINLKLLSQEQPIEEGLWRDKNNYDDKFITDDYSKWVKTHIVQDISGGSVIVSQQLRPNQANIVKSIYVEPYTGNAFLPPY